MKDAITYVLKGVRGWSIYNYKTINVANIVSLEYNKRLFKIFDRDYNWTLKIKYSIDPVINNKGDKK